MAPSRHTSAAETFVPSVTLSSGQAEAIKKRSATKADRFPPIRVCAT
jgi:hypothetical protein